MNTDKRRYKKPIRNCEFQIPNCGKRSVSSLYFAFGFFCILSIFSTTARAQEVSQAQNFHQWGAVTLFNGLPADKVRAVAQTSDGVLWFGTDNGLARFDGRRVQTVAFETAENNIIFALKAANDKTLWIGTEKGAYFYDGANFWLVEETKNISVTAIYISDKIWLATGDGAVFAVAFNKENNVFSICFLKFQKLK